MLSLLIGLVLLAAAWGFFRLRRIAAIGAAYKAKVMASAVFVSGRSPESVLAEDVSADSYGILRLFGARVDRQRQTVTASFCGLWPRTAAFRPGLGATLALGRAPEALRPRSLPMPDAPEEAPASWPAPARLAEVVAEAFAESAPQKPRRTRAVVVVQDGRIVAERYAPGFGPGMPLPGWSVTKGVLNALVGVLVGEGRLELSARKLLPEWSAPGDPRREISLEDLLRMRSGLRFGEVYHDPLSDVTRMLFAEPDAGAFAAGHRLAAPPGTVWAYASGTTNIIARVLRRVVGGTDEEFLSWPRRVLFDPLGMASAVMEPDASGGLVPSSFMLATARDWARFGQLFAQDGVWEGQRILPDGWVAFSARPTPQSPEGCYGAHWWPKLSREFGGAGPAAARIPADAFHAMGHEGQAISIVPSQRLVVVRLGLSVIVDAWDQASFLAAVLDAVR